MSTDREVIVAALKAKAIELQDAAEEIPKNAALYLDRASMFEVAAAIAKTTTTQGDPA